jgi:hypothetical protein
MSSVLAHETADQFNRFAEHMSMPARCDASLSFEALNLADAAALWREKADGHTPPERSDFNARTLKAFLPNVIIADRIDEGSKLRYRFRLMGTAISELLGEHTGKFVDEAVISPFRERWFGVLETANKAGAPLRIFGRLEYRQQNYIAMEMVVAPLGRRIAHADAILVIANPSYSARHVFHPLVKNKLTAPDAVAS